jgi:hypothetical protein
MSQKDLSVSSERNPELKTPESQDDPEHVSHKTNLARVSGVESGLQLAECDVDIEDELLEASLEGYQ